MKLPNLPSHPRDLLIWASSQCILCAQPRKCLSPPLCLASSCQLHGSFSHGVCPRHFSSWCSPFLRRRRSNVLIIPQSTHPASINTPFLFSGQGSHLKATSQLPEQEAWCSPTKEAFSKFSGPRHYGRKLMCEEI